MGIACPWLAYCSWTTVVATMAEWWSIEVHGEPSAARWKAAHGSSLTESAISNGVVDWAWHEYRWGVVFEAAFEDQAQWEAFRALASVQAALAAAPDPINGLLVHRGGGGSSGAPSPQQPPPLAAAGAAPTPAPPTTAAMPVATPPPGSVDRWEGLRGGLLAFLIVMAIILLTLGFIMVLVLAPALGF
jgi:hypothetical protein